MIKQEKKCRHCKEQFTPYHFNQKYCFKDECKEEWIRTAKMKEQKEWKKRKRIIAEEIKPMPKLLSEAQRIFNAWIRSRDLGRTCISCDKKLTGKFDAGHYFSQGGHSAIRFFESNCHGQCVECNQHKHGNLIQYGLKIRSRITEDELNELIELSKKVKKWTRPEVEGIITEYKKRLKESF